MENKEAEEKTLEQAFHELEEITARLEDRETSLEDSFALYQKGVALVRLCTEKLDTVEKKILQLNEDGTTSEFSR